jgi:hypothetical protein
MQSTEPCTNTDDPAVMVAQTMVRTTHAHSREDFFPFAPETMETGIFPSSSPRNPLVKTLARAI